LRRAAVLALAACLLAPRAFADGPKLRPTRDVEVIYRSEAGPQPLEQRVRWDAEAQTMRIDPPTTGLYVIIDYLTRRMSVVHEAEKSVIEMAAPAGMANVPGEQAPGSFVRQGEATVGGLGCTVWQTVDRTGQPAEVCVTDDGVLLRAGSAGRTLVAAVKVEYAPQDASLFRVPADYVRRSAGAGR
jgi:hypothetical protein